MKVKGQSIFEVVIAIGVIGIIISGVVALATTSIRNSTFTRNKSLAARYAQEAVEWMRGERDAGWVTFHTYAGTATYCLDTLAWGNTGACSSTETISGTILSREITFSGVLPTQVNAAVRVSWTDSQGVHQVTTSTVLTDWKSR